MRHLALFVFLLCFNTNKTRPQTDFDAFSNRFVSGYKALHLPQFSLGFVQNLQSIQPIDSVRLQQAFFEQIKLQLKSFNPAQLTAPQQQDYEQITYETALNLERITLEKEWLMQANHQPGDGGLYTIPNGKQWYTYFLKRWLGADVTPDEAYQFGLKEVERVKGHIEKIRVGTGMSKAAFYKHLNDPVFFTNNRDSIQQAFEHTKSVIYAHLDRLFSLQSIPELTIKPGENKNLAQTPGYYDGKTFYYNLFDHPYNKRQFDWLFIHEGVPGHHYMETLNERHNNSEVQKQFYYLGLSEGWAAYTEELGKHLGVYKTPYDELGKWEWDIVRSVRVPMEVGINYYGWTDEQALAFWKKNITGQDDIAMREIARVKRWPAQSITYKYGALQIMQWKAILQKREGSLFDIKHFHDKILQHGSLPIFMVKKNVLG